MICCRRCYMSVTFSARFQWLKNLSLGGWQFLTKKTAPVS
jgi:hypothetical protein